MKSRAKYIILVISLLGLVLLVYNSIKWLYWEHKLLHLSKILFGLGLICLILFFRKKEWKKSLTRIMLVSFSLSLFLGVIVTYQHFDLKRQQAVLNEYDQIETCDGLKERFEVDLKKNELKYFDFGMFGDVDLRRELKKKYNIESFGMGCLVDIKAKCYNGLVNEYLIEKYNDSIVNSLY